MCIASYLRFGPSLASLATFFFPSSFPAPHIRNENPISPHFPLAHAHAHTYIHTLPLSPPVSFRLRHPTVVSLSRRRDQGATCRAIASFFAPLPLVPLVVVRHKSFAGDTGLFARDPPLLLSSSFILVSTFRIPNSQILELKAASHSFKVPVVYLSIYLSIYLIVSQAAFITHSITHSLTHFPTLQDLSDSDSDSDSGRLVNLFRSLLR